MKIAALDIRPRDRNSARSALYLAGHERIVAAARPPGPPPLRHTVSGPVQLDAQDKLAVSICRSLDEVAETWRAFETEAQGTLYQSSLWCRAWVETVGSSLRASPCIVVGRHPAGRVQFMLPLQIRRRQGVRVVEWLGAPHLNYGYGLFDKGFVESAGTWFAENWSRILEEIGGHDAVCLTEMPDRLFGHAHPLASAFNMLGANLSFSVRLEPEFARLQERKRHGEDRRTARKKETALAQQGDITFGLPAGRAETHRVLDIMFDQQAERLAERGVHGVFGPRERLFIHRLADMQDDDNPVLAPYRLMCGNETLAVMLGGLHGNGYWALIASLAQGSLRKFSPGDLALRRTIAACCEAGMGFVDFSAGDSPYKRAWADEIIQLHTSLGARTLRGLMWAAAMGLRLAVKRAIKTSPSLLAFSTSVRRLCLGRQVLRR